MNLQQFIDSPYINGWIAEPGLEYYVKKWAPFRNVIVLANVHSTYEAGLTDKPTPGAYWRFIRRYAHRVPFIAEQVQNKDLAQFYERLKWPGFGMTGCAAYTSPLTMSLYGHSQYLNPYGSDPVPSIHIY